MPSPQPGRYNSRLSELRKDPITGRWVIVLTGRPQRPSDFVREPFFTPSGGFCPFCEGHEEKTPPEVLAFRSSGPANGAGWSVRVVPNKFPALRVEGELGRQGEGMFDKMNGIGAHEVVIECPDHQVSLADLAEKQVRDVLWAFRCRTLDLKQDRRLRYIVLFKNHGPAAGGMLEHTHSQLIALPVVPGRVREELDGAASYFHYKERCIYCDLVHQESQAGIRVVTETERFLVVEPYAPRFPFETWIVPTRHESHYEDADQASLENLAWVLRATLRKLDKVLERPAYNFTIHTAPLQESAMAHYHWHIEIMPKLTRVAGFEWATGFHINPTPPEESARFLREVGVV